MKIPATKWRRIVMFYQMAEMDTNSQIGDIIRTVNSTLHSLYRAFRTVSIIVSIYLLITGFLYFTAPHTSLFSQGKWEKGAFIKVPACQENPFRACIVDAIFWLALGICVFFVMCVLYALINSCVDFCRKI